MDVNVCFLSHKRMLCCRGGHSLPVSPSERPLYGHLAIQNGRHMKCRLKAPPENKK